MTFKAIHSKNPQALNMRRVVSHIETSGRGPNEYNCIVIRRRKGGGLSPYDKLYNFTHFVINVQNSTCQNLAHRKKGT